MAVLPESQILSLVVDTDLLLALEEVGDSSELCATNGACEAQLSGLPGSVICRFGDDVSSDLF